MNIEERMATLRKQAQTWEREIERINQEIRRVQQEANATLEKLQREGGDAMKQHHSCVERIDELKSVLEDKE